VPVARALVPSLAQLGQDALHESLHARGVGEVHEPELEVIDAGRPEAQELGRHLVRLARHDVEIRPVDGGRRIVHHAQPGHLGAHDRARVATDRAAMLVEDGRLALERFHRAHVGAPPLGQVGHEAEGPSFAAAADHQRDHRLRSRRHHRVADLVVRAVEGLAAAQPEGPDDPGGLFELIQSAPGARERVAELGVLAWVVARPQAKDEPSGREQLQVDGDLGEVGRIPEALAADHRPPARRIVAAGQPGQRRHAFEVALVAPAHVVLDPDRVEAGGQRQGDVALVSVQNLAAHLPAGTGPPG
jgi:hypothetical protein